MRGLGSPRVRFTYDSGPSSRCQRHAEAVVEEDREYGGGLARKSAKRQDGEEGGGEQQGGDSGDQCLRWETETQDGDLSNAFSLPSLLSSILAFL